jgi:hypothetical protein
MTDREEPQRNPSADGYLCATCCWTHTHFIVLSLAANTLSHFWPPRETIIRSRIVRIGCSNTRRTEQSSTTDTLLPSSYRSGAIRGYYWSVHDANKGINILH